VKCPACESWSEVKDTRINPKGELRRRRFCGNGHRFSTIEHVVVSKARNKGTKKGVVHEPA
jgi:transcriptional regulator NrdR family protein